jgi:hypothetical protein
MMPFIEKIVKHIRNEKFTIPIKSYESTALIIHNISIKIIIDNINLMKKDCLCFETDNFFISV